MKKLLGIGILIMILLVACSSKAEIYRAGIYLGAAEGYHSTINVQVTVNKKQITHIKVLEHEETPIIADAVISTIPKKVIKKNSTDIDTVSGATYTSKTLLKAIENALESAKIKD